MAAAIRYPIRDLGFTIGLLAALCGVSYLVLGDHWQAPLVAKLAYFSGYLLLAGLECVLPTAGPRKSTQRKWMHVHITLANLAIQIPFVAFFGAYLAGAIVKFLGIDLGLIDLTFNRAYGVLGIFGSAMLFAIGMDFFYYWFHRALHTYPILWQHHKLHHADPEFDALTGLRFNWLEFLFLGVLYSLPGAILFKADRGSYLDAGWVNALVLYIIMMCMMINHSNLRIQFGRASFLWTSSQSHRIHHSLLPEHRDRNFVAVFPLWDVLFGTYYAPKWNEFPPTGVEDQPDIESFWEVQVFTFREWWKMFRAWRARRSTVPV